MKRHHIAVAVLGMVVLANCALAVESPAEGLVLIPAGSFQMGDHFGFVDPKHGSDEVPIHNVRLDAYWIGRYDVTTREYCAFLNSAFAKKMIEVRQGGVYLRGGSDLLCDTRQLSPSSCIGFDGTTFSVLEKKENHPMVCVRWHGAAVYCNWLGAQKGRPACYNTATWDCDFNKSGFRLPTEAEWEYAARGGHNDPYFNYPWGNDPDPTKANVPESTNPFRAGARPTAPPRGYRASNGPPGQAWRMGAIPLTTPVGFFNGKLQQKSDFNWAGDADSFQTSDGANSFGLYDMAGNVWQWCTELYHRGYYSFSPAENPPGPANGSTMPDGKVYRCIRGGSWFNGEFGHSRVSNRDPSYYRGPDPVTGLSDADGPWFHIGFRVVMPVDAERRPAMKPTPVPERYARAREPGDQGGGGGDRGGPRRANESDRGGPRRPGEGGPDGAARAPHDPAPPARAPKSSFTLRSSAVADGAALPTEFTGDGAGISPPLEWAGAPANTACYAIIMHHTDARGANKCYWILYNIPATTHGLTKGAKTVGTFGINSLADRADYAPPHSKGPGTRTYIVTIYALSAPVQFADGAAQVTQDVLLAAMKDKIVAMADLAVTHTRYTVNGGNENQEQSPPPRADEPGRNQRDDRSGGGAGNGGGGSDNSGGAGGGQRRFGGGPGGGGGGGGRVSEHNKTPASPNPGQTVGLFINTPKACPGYTLIAPKHNTQTYLIDNAGRIVHQWNSEYYPGQSVYLKPNGNLLRTCMYHNRSFTGGGEGGRIEEYDWAGNLVWENWYTNDQHQQHHDIAPMPNGNILMLVVERRTREECLAAGFPESMLRDQELYPDSIVEIQPTYPKSAKIVWQWRVWDHMIQDFDRAKANYGNPAEHPELIYLGGGRGVPAFWNHVNSIAYNAKLDQVMLSARGHDEVWVIDHSTTSEQATGHAGGKHGKGGDLIYRWGNSSTYKRGTTADHQLNQQHDGEWIPDGYPGAGHITIFNNGYNRGYTSIEEIVPPIDAAGHYILQPGKAFGPEKVFWHYEAKNRTDFFSSEISGAHRLPNGNTLICAGVIGHLFEVTPAGEMVWQYVNPVVRGGILAQGELPGKDVRGHLFNAVFKAHRYAPDYAGLAGRDLTPKGFIELPASQKGKTGMDQADAQPGERPVEPGGGGGGGGGGQRGGDRPPPPDGGDRGGDRPPRPDGGGRPGGDQ